MSPRIVVASNRVPAPEGGEIPPGGLVSALGSVLCGQHESLWFGWSGQLGDADSSPQRAHARSVDFATVDLTEEELHGYYEHYCNEVLWPALHGMPERIRRECERDFSTYLAVNRRFARSLAPLLRRDDLVWVHDYHLIPLGAELRAQGFDGKIGYFHHVPIPTEDAWSEIPHVDRLADAFEAYDLIGLQTRADVRRLRALLPYAVAKRVRPFPISVDPEDVRRLASSTPPPLRRDGRMLFFGVDRLDYTKGIPHRLRGYGLALQRRPEMREATRFVQWSAPSRTEILDYQLERQRVEAAARAVNGPDGAPDVPLALSFESHPRAEVAAALAQADVCLVTSVADGMNLVAKEYAAVHSAEHPGVLILSDSCGAAEELTDALIYPAGDLEALAACIERAYEMPMAERRRRAAGLRAAVDSHTSDDWSISFLDELASTAEETAVGGAVGTTERPRELEEVR